MPESIRLSELVSVRGRFMRSVHLERDAVNGSLVEYHLTESACYALRSVASALERPMDRAMTLVGPYGAGKSAFCVALARVLGTQPPEGILAAIAEVDPALLRSLRRLEGGLLPVLIVGERRPIGRALAEGLVRALKAGGHGRLLECMERESAGILDRSDPSPRQIADLYLRAAELARVNGYSGVLLVVDELGKFLEYAALHPRDGDIFVLQELAEAAVRSSEAPLLFVTVLHQNAENYAQRLGRTHQAEWAKVGERLRQVPFFPSDAELMEMVGRALWHSPRLRLNGQMDRLSQMWLDLRLPYAGSRERFSGIARKAYPLHPVTLLALPSLFRKAGQSHRSLFGFLSGEEPHALGRFLREASFEDAAPPLFMPHMLFDYAAEVLIGGWGASLLTRLWADAVDAVERAVALPELALHVLKCVALLGVLKEPRLPASEAVLTLALTDCSGQTPDVRGALEELQRRRLIVYSRARAVYRLWEGGDIDVEAELASARSSLPASTTLHVATNLCKPADLIARRHSYDTGTVRVVRVSPCGAAQLEAAIRRTGRDLSVLLCLASTAEELDDAERQAAATKLPHVLIATAVETEVLRDTAADVAAASKVAEEVHGLQHDRAARRELDGRRLEAQILFRAEWNRVFSVSSGAASWWYCGERIAFSSSRDFSRFLSRMADAVYPDAPRIRNELINRCSLSSAAAAARHRLIEAMLARGSEKRLGIEGYPPELSMYECLLRTTGLHREGPEGRWQFGPPPAEDPGRLRRCWRAMETFVFSGPPKTRPVPELFELLRSSPYGATDGVLPVLLCAFFLANRDEMTLYREGTYLPEPGIADFEVLMRRPELFAVAGCRVAGARAAIVGRIASRLGIRAGVVPVVRALFQMVRSLPEHAHKTRRLPPAVLAVRDAFSQARSPEALLFQDLPRALGVPLPEDVPDPAVVEAFFRALNEALADWAAAMPAAIARARDALLDSCGIEPGDHRHRWDVLRRQAEVLRGRVVPANLQPFLVRVTTTDDPEAALQSVLSLLADRPPKSWSDADFDCCLERARSMGELFRKARSGEESTPEPALSPEEKSWSQQIALKVRGQWDENTPRQVVLAALLSLVADVQKELRKDVLRDE